MRTRRSPSRTAGLVASLAGIGLMVLLGLLILRKGAWGLGILLGLAAVYFLTTLLSEVVKIYGQKVPGRDHHP